MSSMWEKDRRGGSEGRLTVGSLQLTAGTPAASPETLPGSVAQDGFPLFGSA